MWGSLTLAVICLSLAVAQEEGVPKKQPFKPPSPPSGDVYFAESFSDPEAVWKRWVKSAAKKDGADADIGKYNGEWVLEELSTEGGLEGDLGLVIKQAAKHYAISAKLDRPFSFEDKDAFVIQYEVNLQKGLNCGGAYLKLLSDTDDLDLENFHDKTAYSIMFGPDKCGLSKKLHVIIRFKNPVTGEIEEKHSKQPENLDFFDDKKTHLFTFLIHSDGVYHVILDQKPLLRGHLLQDLSPPIAPPEEINDPDDKMPSDWDEREKIPDPDAVKPDDWDEDAPPKIVDPKAVKPEGWLDDGPEYIPDPDASLPEDWDEEEDGEWEPPLILNPACEEVGCGKWEAPMIQNPEFKGRWKPPLIENPNYMGKWEPRQIPNTAYFEEEMPFFRLTPIAAVGFELWTMSEDIFFDNILVTSELTVANNYAREGWILKYESEREVGGAMSLGPWLDWFVGVANEHPYLWALYAFAIVSPCVLIAAFCIKTKPKPKDEAAERKKTDAPSPDDPQAQQEQEQEQEPTEEEKPTGPTESFIASAEDEEQEQEKKEPPPQEEEEKEEEEEKGEEEEEKGEEEKGGEETTPETKPETPTGSQEGDVSQGEDSQEGEGSQEEHSQGEEEEAAAKEEETGTPKAKSKARKRRAARRED